MYVFILLVLVLCIILLSKFLSFKSNFSNLFFISTVLFLVASIIVFPKNSVDAALEGVNIWLFVIIPSFFPFFIGSELLIHSGLLDFVGTVLEPIMYPLFKIPGKGSFVFAMSVTSGYPIGASLVSELRVKNSIKKDEAQRLLALSSTSGPLFMIGAVSIGMLQNATVGTLLSLAHYMGAITVGLIFRYYGSSSKESIALSKRTNSSYIKRSFRSLTKLKNRKLTSVSTLMSNAIEKSFKSLFMVGGFIIIYSVIIEILNITNIIPQISNIIDSLLPVNLNTELTNSLVSGLIELTNGCKNISTLNVDIIVKLCLISFLIGWGGISVHSQAMSFMSRTDISTKVYLLSKALHGLVSSFYTYILYIYFFKEKIDIVKVHNLPKTSSLTAFVYAFKTSIKLGLIALCIIMILSIFMSIILNLKNSQIK